jgi:hypothetical protein
MTTPNLSRRAALRRLTGAGAAIVASLAVPIVVPAVAQAVESLPTAATPAAEQLARLDAAYTRWRSHLDHSNPATLAKHAAFIEAIADYAEKWGDPASGVKKA